MLAYYTHWQSSTTLQAFFLSFKGNVGIFWYMAGICSLEGILYNLQAMGASYTHWHAYYPWRYFIIARKWGLLLLNVRHIITDRHLLNIRHLTRTRNDIIVEWIFSLCRVILVPLNILITLRIITFIFVSVCDIFCLRVPLYLPTMYYKCNIIVKLFCSIFLIVLISL